MFVLGDSLWELVKNWKQRPNRLAAIVAIADLPRHSQFVFERAGGYVVRLRCRDQQQAFKRLVEPSPDLAKHLGGVLVASKEMQLVEERQNQDGPGQNVEVERLDLQFRVRDEVNDRLVVWGSRKAPLQIGRFVNHRRGLLIGPIGNNLRGSNKQRLHIVALVHQHRGDHQPGTVGRLGLTFRGHREDVPYCACPRCWIPRPEGDAHQVAKPLPRGLPERHLIETVRQRQGVKYRQR